MKKNIDYLALALDNCTSPEALANLVCATAPSIGVFKIGLEQFTRFGPSILGIVRRQSRKIFLDLKFHDIPNTVAKSVESACDLGADYLTIHCSGGIAMMVAAKAAADGAEQRTGKRPKIIGVTVLTSIDEACLRSELGVPSTVGEQVRRLAENAVKAGLDGIVCSAADLPEVKSLLPGSFEIITPGIRPAGSSAHDQKRTATPATAIAAGATLLVLGRAVTEAHDQGKAAAEILAEIEKTIAS